MFLVTSIFLKIDGKLEKFILKYFNSRGSLSFNKIFHVNNVFKLIPPPLLPLFFYGVSCFSNIIVSKLINFSFLGSSFNINISWTWSSLLTRAKMVFTTHSFENSLLMVPITLNAEAINFFLCCCSVVALIFTFKSGCLKN